MTAVLGLIPLSPTYPCVFTPSEGTPTHTLPYVRVPPHTENTGRGNRNSSRLSEKITASAAVWVWHSSASSFQLSATVWERGRLREITTKCRNQWLSYCLTQLSERLSLLLWYHLFWVLSCCSCPTQLRQRGVDFEELLKNLSDSAFWDIKVEMK